MTEVEPVCAYGPGSPLMDHWRARADEPLVTLRCGRGKRKCRRALVHIFESPIGALVVFYRSQPDMPVRMTPEAREVYEISRGTEGVRAWDENDGVALVRGRRDVTGTVVALESNDYWHDIVHAGCIQHGRADDLNRAALMQDVRHARNMNKAIDRTLL